MIAKHWLNDLIVPLQKPPMLSRDEFVGRYMPQYVRPYEPPSGIRLTHSGRPMMSTKASNQAQVTKRENRIDAAYQEYIKHWEIA